MHLGVNIDHIATLRQARYAGGIDARNAEPDVLAAAAICERAGAHGITIHLRADRRHIQDADVFRLREKLTAKMNLELGNTPEILEIALRVKPHEVCLVPEHRREVTTEGGLDVVAAEKSLTETRMMMNDAGIEVSLFIAPDEQQIAAAARTGSQFIELHTGQFAEHFSKSETRNPKSEIECEAIDNAGNCSSRLQRVQAQKLFNDQE